jgi:hypothetical protein
MHADACTSDAVQRNPQNISCGSGRSQRTEINQTRCRHLVGDCTLAPCVCVREQDLGDELPQIDVEIGGEERGDRLGVGGARVEEGARDLVH